MRRRTPLIGLMLIVAFFAAAGVASAADCGGLTPTIVDPNGDGDGFIVGTSGDDVIDGLGGDDVIDGDAGNDFICGGSGDDVLYGFDGNDVLLGDDGDDILFGEADSDFVLGRAGADAMSGGGGGDAADYELASGAVTVNLASGQATGAEGNDTLIGIENLMGSAYDDTLTGDGAGNIFWGLAGNDTINGAGADRVSYEYAAGSVNANLASGQATGAEGNDTLAGIENLMGSVYDDTLTGDGGNNAFWGRAGNDTINGAGGTDSVSYQLAAAPVDANLTSGQATGAEGNDTLSGIENLMGSGYDDTLTGDGGNNIFWGQTGNDTINGAGGSDDASYQYAAGPVDANLTSGQATGAEGNDTLAGIENLMGSVYGDTLTGDSAGNIFWGLDGNDTIDGAGGSDRVSYEFAMGPVAANLTSGQATGAEGNDTLAGIENLMGSVYGDTLTGDSAGNIFWGLDGNDAIDGADGRTDGVSYEYAAGPVTANLTSGQASGAEGNDTLAGIENLIGSEFGDTLIGDEHPNAFWPGTGDDQIVGVGISDDGSFDDLIAYDDVPGPQGVTVDLAAGEVTGAAGHDEVHGIGSVIGTEQADVLRGADASDGFQGGGGDDEIDGRGGNDSVFPVPRADGPIIASMTVGNWSSPLGGTDRIADIENLKGSDSRDVLIGDAAMNVLDGEGGDDDLFAKGGDDIIYGGSGADRISGGSGTANIVSYADAPSGVHVDLSEGTGLVSGSGETDLLTEINWVYGSVFDDVLVGNEAENYFDGGPGDDSIDGRGGIDWVGYSPFVGPSIPLIDQGPIEYDAAAGTVDDKSGGWRDQLTQVESVFGSVHDDRLVGDAGRDYLLGMEGDDTMAGRGGDDFFNATFGSDRVSGGDDDDYLSYSSSEATGIKARLGGGEIQEGAATDDVRGIELLRGTDQRDVLIGGAADEVLFGSEGDDVLRGRAGDDTLLGGTDDDLLVGGAGLDHCQKKQRRRSCERIGVPRNMRARIMAAKAFEIAGGGKRKGQQVRGLGHR